MENINTSLSRWLRAAADAIEPLCVSSFPRTQRSPRLDHPLGAEVLSRSASQLFAALTATALTQLTNQKIKPVQKGTTRYNKHHPRSKVRRSLQSAAFKNDKLYSAGVLVGGQPTQFSRVWLSAKLVHVASTFPQKNKTVLFGTFWYSKVLAGTLRHKTLLELNQDRCPQPTPPPDHARAFAAFWHIEAGASHTVFCKKIFSLACTSLYWPVLARVP
jgi:hypothetical protein